MSCGKPVVATDWSANTEFCHADTSWPVPYSMTPILPHEYMATMVEWADADIDAAARCLREIYDGPEKAAARAACGQKFMIEHFSLANFKASVEAFLNGEEVCA